MFGSYVCGRSSVFFSLLWMLGHGNNYYKMHVKMHVSKTFPWSRLTATLIHICQSEHSVGLEQKN